MGVASGAPSREFSPGMLGGGRGHSCAWKTHKVQMSTLEKKFRFVAGKKNAQ